MKYDATARKTIFHIFSHNYTAKLACHGPRCEAVYKAVFKDKMDNVYPGLETTCPKCGHENQHKIDFDDTPSDGELGSF
ncbi:MAG: hypothetical protein V1648_03385 [Candidatus Aenigmatarchaeota archaeon]